MLGSKTICMTAYTLVAAGVACCTAGQAAGAAMTDRTIVMDLIICAAGWNTGGAACCCIMTDRTICSLTDSCTVIDCGMNTDVKGVMTGYTVVR